MTAKQKYSQECGDEPTGRGLSNELIDRIRRIETKLSRFIAGEPEQTNYTAEVWGPPDDLEIDVNSMSISLQAIIEAARAAGCAGEEVTVCDNGKPRMVFRLVHN